MRVLRNKVTLLTAMLLLCPMAVLGGEFKVTRVYGGDTVSAEDHDITIKIRLVGIDAPETAKGKGNPGQPYSQTAKKYLGAMVLNKVVDVKGYGLGPYNHVLGVITSEGRNVNLEMLKAGLAEVYRGKAPYRFPHLPYWQAEKEAKDDMKGMWSQGDRYISPKDWRKMQRKK